MARRSGCSAAMRARTTPGGAATGNGSSQPRDVGPSPCGARRGWRSRRRPQVSFSPVDEVSQAGNAGVASATSSWRCTQANPPAKKHRRCPSIRQEGRALTEPHWWPIREHGALPATSSPRVDAAGRLHPAMRRTRPTARSLRPVQPSTGARSIAARSGRHPPGGGPARTPSSSVATMSSPWTRPLSTLSASPGCPARSPTANRCGTDVLRPGHPRNGVRVEVATGTIHRNPPPPDADEPPDTRRRCRVGRRLAIVWRAPARLALPAPQHRRHSNHARRGQADHRRALRRT